MILPSIPAHASGRGLATGLEHRYRYNAMLSNNSGGQNGNSWIVTSLPYLHYSTETTDDLPDLVVLMGAGGAQWDYVSDTGYVGRFGTKRQLFVEGADFRMLSPDGSSTLFYGPDAVASLRGRFKNSVSAKGVITALIYDENNRISGETRTDPVTGDQAGLFYKFAPPGIHAGRIVSVEKRLVVGGASFAIKRWLFTYHSGNDDAGNLNDLKSSEEQVWDFPTAEWAGSGRRYFRYYTSDSGVGFKHGLRYVLDPDGWFRMAQLGLDPENTDQVSDSVLERFSAEYFEYDASHRPSKIVRRGGTETSTFDRLVSDGGAGRNWTRREIETRPDAATVTTYFDTAQRPVLKILDDGLGNWAEYWEYNAQSREILHATPSAIASFTEPADGSENFAVTLKTDAGLIETKDYYPESGGDAGSAPGYLKEDAIKEGSAGTTIKQRELSYVARTVGSDTIYKTADSTVFRDSSGGGTSPATTSNTYTWRDATFALLQHTVTPPVVGTGENGTGETTTHVTVFDDFGNAQWRKNERGRIDYDFHDRLTGALRFRIEDADTVTLTAVPTGWTTAAGFGSNRRTDCHADMLGRATLVLGPAHLVPTKNAEGSVEPVLTRHADFACYRDGAREIRAAKGGSTFGGLYTLGTVTLRRLDYSNREVEVVEAARACECGPISPNEAFPQSAWKRWRREFYNAAAYRDESRVWHGIPATGEGFENTNFYATRYGRDAMGRENRVASPGGTINRSVIDARGLTASVWIGTNDTGATDDDPTGGGATGNNMVLVTENAYDGGSDGGNGNLTSIVRPVDSNSANDREDNFDYDFRDRLLGESRSDGANTFLVRYTLDNVGLTTQTDSYHTSVSSGNLTARSVAYYDVRGRLYKDETYTVDPEDGTVGGALVSQRWRDAVGNVLKETFQGNEAFLKRSYDAFNRVIFSYNACNPSGGSDNNNPAADTVVEQSEMHYDPAGNLIQSTAWQRFHDATGTGPLHGPNGAQPRAIRRYACWWQDAVGREIASADYGTNGGAVLVRPSTPPSTSAEVLVTRTRHASTGEPGAVIDPMGTETRWKRDAIGREVETIENFREGAAPAADVNRTTRFGYHPSGGLETLTLVNDVTGDQTTRWIYGTTLADSEVATGHLLRAKIYPVSDDASTPLGDGPDGIFERTEHTYNRQGEIVTTTDPNETVHAYDRDKLGRLLHDRITAFGSGIDPTVKRISIAYEAKRLLTAKVSSHDDATPGEGSVLNEVAYAYDGLGQQIKDRQAHGGAVAPGTTPEVEYDYVNP